MVTDSAPSQVDATVDAETDSGFTQSLEWTVRRFQDRFGRSWVPGYVVLTSDTMKFFPQESAGEATSPTPIAMLLNEVVDISTESRLFRKTVQVTVASGQTLAFRCRRASEVFAEQLRTAAGAARAMSA